MNFYRVLHTLGQYFFFYAVCFLPSLGIALAHKNWKLTHIFGGLFGVILILGGALSVVCRSRGKGGYFTKKEGLLTVSLIWILSGIIGALPFYLSGYIPLFISAVFESVSGFTTTGASVLTDIEILPHSLLFWRSFTHFLGGLGIVVLFIAILPYLGVGGRVLFQSEVPGPEADVLKPKIQETAFSLLKIYVFFTLIETILLVACNMTFFDAICHSFGTLATGGFSTKNASIAHYQDWRIEGIIIIFMFLAGANFSLYFYFLKGERKTFFKNSEFKTYAGMIILSTLTIALYLTWNYRADFITNLRESLFQVVSLQTSTGYGLADFEKWPDFTQLLLLSLMLVGGCAGSTGGGIKVIRWIIVVKYIFCRLQNVAHPHAVMPVKIHKKALSDELVKSVVGLFLLWLLILGLSSLILTFMGVDLLTATTACLTTLNNIGPGLALVGPTDNFAVIPEMGKVVLIICMLFGRLEIYTLILLFLPSFWKQ